MKKKSLTKFGAISLILVFIATLISLILYSSLRLTKKIVEKQLLTGFTSEKVEASIDYDELFSSYHEPYSKLVFVTTFEDIDLNEPPLMEIQFFGEGDKVVIKGRPVGWLRNKGTQSWAFDVEEHCKIRSTKSGRRRFVLSVNISSLDKIDYSLYYRIIMQ